MSASQPLEADWVFLERAADDLQDYLLSPELYWTLSREFRFGKSAPLPRLTLGNLLLSLKRLKVYPWEAGQSRTLNALSERIFSIRDRWTYHWQEKVKKEIPVRLSIWENYLSEAAEHGISIAEYKYQVRSRVILSLLRDEGVVWKPVEMSRLESMDSLLAKLISPGPFIWEAELESGFPKGGFPFLYVSFERGA